MKLKIKLCCSLLFCAVFTSAFSAEKKPDWFKSPETVFPATEYIRATGNGATEKKAQIEAVSQISATFKTKVKVVNTALSDLKYSSENDKTSFSKTDTFTQDYTAVSEAELYCLNFTDTFYNKKDKQYYVVAYINRKEAFKILQTKINPLVEEIQAILDSVNKEKEPLYRCFLYQKATSLGNLATAYIENALVIDSKKASVYDKDLLLISKINGLREKQSEKITFNVTCNNKNAKDLISGVSSILEESGFVFTKSKPMYKVAIDISFSEEIYEAGEFVRPAVTITVDNSNGEPVESYSKVYHRYTHGSMENSYKLSVIRVQQDLEENFLACYRNFED